MGTRNKQDIVLRIPSNYWVLWASLFCPFKSYFTQRLMRLQIIHFPILKFYQDSQPKTALLMREMNQLHLFFSLQDEKGTVPYLFPSLALKRNLFLMPTKHKFQGGSISQVVYSCRKSCSCLLHPKPILLGFQAPPPLKRLPESSRVTFQSTERLFDSPWQLITYCSVVFSNLSPK